MKIHDICGKDLLEVETLRRADLSRVDLRRAILNGTDLSDSYLSGSDLSNADLSNADLSNADLRNTNLSNADLSNADLRHADLRHANLNGADLRDALLNGCVGNGVEIFSLNMIRYRVAYTKDMLAIGCKQYTHKEWSSFSNEEIAAMGSGALEWWEKHKESLLKTIKSSFLTKE